MNADMFVHHSCLCLISAITPEQSGPDLVVYLAANPPANTQKSSARCCVPQIHQDALVSLIFFNHNVYALHR